MEKMKLARNLCKTVYGFRFRTINQRLKNTIKEFGSLTVEYSKVREDPNIKNILSSSTEAKLFGEATQQFDKSLKKLYNDFKHFKEHEEPNLEACNMLRTYVEPFIATTLAGSLLGVIAYKSYLKGKNNALDEELSAETAE
ncbi:hypothetical protein MKX03_001138 [Papaver bracteatum]|nr:hypothetical protein MKX03_001138 [Papaver bracteatum]